ncbi:MAG: translocation/assembly module TamB domain-containing protein [Candidatus Acidiferrales bacterium]
MKPAWKRWIRRVAIVLLVFAGAIAVIVMTGLDERWARGAVVGEIEKMTGARVELGAFHFHLWGLRAELDALTLHGREAEGMPPLFHADRIRLKLRIVSFFGRKIALNELEIDRPAVFIRVDEQGHSNVTSPPVQTKSAPWRQQLFNLEIGKLRLADGSLEYNETRIPLAAEGQDFQFRMEYHADAPGKEIYTGALAWKQVELAARRYLPFASDVEMKFTLARDSFSLDEFRWKLPRSEFEGRAELASFARPDWSFEYRGQFALGDLRAILRKPRMPEGEAEFSGSGTFAAGQLTMSGNYHASKIGMGYHWFHAKGMESSGRFEVAHGRLTVPQLQARAFGGTLNGRLEMEFHNLQFRVVSQARGLSLAAVLSAVDNANFPVHTLHWDATMEVDSTTTWTADFKHFRSSGESRWIPAPTPAIGMIPAAALIEFDYSMDHHGAEFQSSEITTPSSRIEFSGGINALDSTLETKFSLQDLLVWDDFINILRGRDAQPKKISGSANWKGRILGPIAGPTFSGHVVASGVRYDQYAWDALDSDLTYSPDEFRLAHALVRHGRSTASLDLQMQFDGAWSFLPESPWSLAVRLSRAPLDDVQDIFGTSYPAHGLLTGDFHAGGTRANSQVSGNFSLDSGDAWGFAVSHFGGDFALDADAIRLTHAQLRTDSGSISGDLTYHRAAASAEFNLHGQGIPLSSLERIQFTSLPIGGTLSFDLRGQGPLRRPAVRGTLRLGDLKIGGEVLDTFDASIQSDGRNLHVQLASATPGKLTGQLDIGLTDDYPLAADVSVEKMDLDPFIQRGLHLAALTGHSSVDGKFHFSGQLLRPETLEVDADLSSVKLGYESVVLENAGEIRLSYRKSEVRIEQAELRGTDTDVRVAGYARFAGDRAVNLTLTGSLDLRIVTGLYPDLAARGVTQANVAIGGTLDSPRVTGRLGVSDASVRYGDFPTGLSHVSGEFVFDRDRLLFENVSAEAGGGPVKLFGTFTYGQGPLRYEIRVVAPQLRIRYPEGMSWLGGGTLVWAGTKNAGSVTGRIRVERLLFAPNVDLATLIVASKGSAGGSATTSRYLQNLQFDVAVDSAPNARMEWNGARVEVEGSLRLRGTWEHPLVIGSVHLLSGEMTFRGTKYQLGRGDIDFSNPFRFDPILNIEATTTIQQYEITLDFTGPASHLQLAYRSDPPLPSSEIIALLAVGSTGEENALRTSGAQTQGYGATALLSEAISSELGGPIQRLFGISRFRVDPFLSGTTTDQNAAARVTIEQQVTRGLTITYSSNATANQEQVVQVEYSIRRGISIVALRDINGTFSLDVKFKKQFK